jgi:hypothetical protein
MLVIVLLNQVPGIPTVTLLQTYSTSHECHNERDRIGDEMAKPIPMTMTLRLPVGSIKTERNELTRIG